MDSLVSIAKGIYNLAPKLMGLLFSLPIFLSTMTIGISMLVAFRLAIVGIQAALASITASYPAVMCLCNAAGLNLMLEYFADGLTMYATVLFYLAVTSMANAIKQAVAETAML